MEPSAAERLETDEREKPLLVTGRYRTGSRSLGRRDGFSGRNRPDQHPERFVRGDVRCRRIRLSVKPQLLLIDGNRFRTTLDIPYRCIVKGDATYASIAAASVLAKTYRDDYMMRIAGEYPVYNWQKNKGYPTGNTGKRSCDTVCRHTTACRSTTNSNSCDCSSDRPKTKNEQR